MQTKQVIHGVCPSKSNCYKIVKAGKFASLAKTPALAIYEKNFYIQCKERGQRVDNYFEFYIDVFYPSQRSDLDNSLKIILDCLQKAGVIKNDNQCVKIVAQKFKDVNDPRVEYFIKEV